MKVTLVLCALVAVVICRPEEGYSTKYDNFDVQNLIGSVRLLKNYCNCFLGTGHCTPEGTDFKKIIPDALKTDCAKCNPKQRQSIRTVVNAIKEKLPDLWLDLVKKEDPEGKYKADFEAFLNSSD